MIFYLTQKARDLHGRAPRLYGPPPANDPAPLLGWIALVLGSGPDTFVKTASKRVLGCMTEQAFMADALIEGDGGLAAVTSVSVSAGLNGSILRPLGPHYHPRDAMRAAVAARLG